MTRVSLGARLRHAIALVLDALGVLDWLRRRRALRGQIPVLMFHRVAGTADRPELLAFPLNHFRELVRHAAQRYQLAAWPDAVAAARTPAAQPVMVLTADDGYADQANLLWPCVHEVGGRLVLFVTRDPMVRQTPFWWDVAHAANAAAEPPPALDRAGLLAPSARSLSIGKQMKRLGTAALTAKVHELTKQLGDAPIGPRALTTEDARRIAAEGATLGGHGVTHASLTMCDDAELASEVRGSRDLDAIAGEHVDVFAYPTGWYDARVTRAVADAGFTWAFTTESGLFDANTDPLRVPRIDVFPALVSPDLLTFSWPLFEAELLGVFDVLFLRRWRGLR